MRLEVELCSLSQYGWKQDQHDEPQFITIHVAFERLRTLRQETSHGMQERSVVSIHIEGSMVVQCFSSVVEFYLRSETVIGHYQGGGVILWSTGRTVSACSGQNGMDAPCPFISHIDQQLEQSHSSTYVG